MLSRRHFSLGLGTVLASGSAIHPHTVLAANAARGDLPGALGVIEKQSGGRLGVAVLDVATGRRWGHRSTERFPMCSTFKLLACGAVLARVDTGQEDLDRRIRFAAGDLLNYSPGTKDHVGGDGMTLAELCRAAMTLSDNTAANLILASLGGPATVTAFARSLGDKQTRLDRIEPDLNQAKPGDPRDTTTPAAMAANLQALILGDRLSGHSREQLVAWLEANQTGNARLRAGLPKDWRIGDKTGTGDWGTANDVAVIWPAGRQPLIVCVYLTEATAGPNDCNAAIAAVGRAVAASRGV